MRSAIFAFCLAFLAFAAALLAEIYTHATIDQALFSYPASVLVTRTTELSVAQLYAFIERIVVTSIYLLLGLIFITTLVKTKMAFAVACYCGLFLIAHLLSDLRRFDYPISYYLFEFAFWLTISVCAFYVAKRIEVGMRGQA